MSEKNDVARGGVKAAVNNALLAYILYSMQSGTAEKIKSVVRTHFAIDDISTAEDMWDAVDQSIIGSKDAGAMEPSSLRNILTRRM